MTDEQIDNTFTYHRPFGTQQKRYEDLRSEAKSLAKTIQRACPESREKSLAITNLQQAIMWARRIMTDEQIDNTFTYHRPFGTQQKRYEDLRSEAKSLAKTIQRACPESREKSLAITNLQQAIMWANASIAINEVDGPQT